MFFEGTFASKDSNHSLFSFYKGDLKHLITLACEAPYAFNDEIGDPIMHFNKLARSSRVLFFCARKERKVIGYIYVDKPPGGIFATITVFLRYRGYSADLYKTVKLAYDYVFEYTDVERIQATIAVENRPAIIGAIMSGMKKEGVLRRACKFNRKVSDLVMLSIIREEYENE